MKYLKALSDSSPPNLESSTSYTPYVLSLTAGLLYPLPWIYCSEHNISISQNAIIRGLTAACFHFATCRLTGSPLDIKQPASLKFLTIRSSILALYLLVLTVAQFILPLPVVHTINCSGQILVFVIDYFLNGVKINWQQAIGVFVGLVGVMVAGNGRAIMELMDGEYVQTTDFKHYITDDIRIISGFTVFFVLMMVFWAYAAVLTKRIKANSYQMNFVLALCSLTTGPLTYPYTNNSSTYQTLFYAVIFTGIPLTMLQTIWMAALRMSRNTGMVSMMGFAAVVTSYFISIFRYNEKPNVIASIGVVLVLFGLWRTIFGKSKN